MTNSTAQARPDLAAIKKLHETGLSLQAYKVLCALAPAGDPYAFQDSSSRLLAARIVQHLGAAERATRLIRRIYHADRQHLGATYYYARQLIDRRGPLPGLRFIEARGTFSDAPPKFRAQWIALQASCLSMLRDFSHAQELIDRAIALAPADPWIHIEQSHLLQSQDRYDDALVSVRESLRLQPDYRPAIQHAAQLHQLLGDDQAALDLLLPVAPQAESIFFFIQLSGLQFELRQYAESSRSLDRLDQIALLLEDPLRKWLRFRRFDIACAGEDLPAAVSAGELIDDDFARNTVSRIRSHLELPPEKRPRAIVRLPVGFVRQHHLTCVPATLSTLCRFWNLPADHMAIAEKICYDGTPHHKERAWADDAGFLTREFTLTWNAGLRLIDRGIPFILTTVAPERGHAQAIIGYDSLRHTFLIRDPYVRSTSEFVADKALHQYRSTGPRCLLVLPRDKPSLLEDVDLPDSPLYDHLYSLQLALDRHDRTQAQTQADALSARGGDDHRLSIYARRCLAAYDANRIATLAATDQLLARYPDDANLLLSRLWSLRDLARREDRIALLHDICSRKKSDPVFWQRYAEEISGDARQIGHAIRLLERRLRRNPYSASAYAGLANALWDLRRFPEAFRLYRLATSIDTFDERLAHSYFVASRHLRKTDEALEFLRGRFSRLGAKSGAPARTLFHALIQLNREPEAFELLDQAIARRPDDPELLLFAANQHVRYAKFDRGLELRARAEPLAHRLNWLYASAQIEELRCRAPEALALWEQLAAADPLCMDAHSAVARLLAETRGRTHAARYLASLAERFPHHFGIRHLLISWLDEPADRLDSIRKLVAIDPRDAWGHRELALFLSSQPPFNHAEALAEATLAASLDPNDPRTFNTLISVHEQAGRIDQALQTARSAISSSVDNNFAVDSLMRLSPSTEARRGQLHFVRQELVRQVIFGDALLTFRRVASTVWTPQEVLGLLQEAHAARPDLWFAWSALITQYAASNDIVEAKKLAHEAVGRFPLVPRLWFDLAQVYAALGDNDGRIAAFQEALAISPAWSYAARNLATAYESINDLDAARRSLEQAVARDPLDPYNHAALAGILFKQGNRSQAIERIEHALLLHPNEQHHWELLHYWARLDGRPHIALEKMRELTRRRAGDAAAWRRLAQMLPPADTYALLSINKAIELEPRNPENYDILAVIHANGPPPDEKRFADAMAACRPLLFGDSPPPLLRARAAWVLHRQDKIRPAIEAMREALRLDQSNLWAWQRLAEWLRQTGDLQEYFRTARRMVELWPRDASSLEYLAHARLLIGGDENRTAAMTELRRALDADPNRSYAADTLFDLYLLDRQVNLARQTLKFIEHTRPLDARIGKARLALAENDGPESLKTFVQATDALFLDPATTRSHISSLRDAVRSNRHAASAFDLAVVRAAGNSNCNNNVLPFSVAVEAAAAHWKEALELVRRTVSGSDNWVEACREYLIPAGKKGGRRSLELINLLLRNEREALRANARSWGVVGYAYTCARRWRLAVNWLDDHARRNDAEAWMLLNLALSLLQLRRNQQAAQIHFRALLLRPDHSHHSHLIRLAILEPHLFVPSPDKPSPFSLPAIQEKNLNSLDRALFPASQIAIEIQRARQNRSRIGRAQVDPSWKMMLGHHKEVPANRALARLYRRVYWGTFRRAFPHPFALQALWRSFSTIWPRSH